MNLPPRGTAVTNRTTLLKQLMNSGKRCSSVFGTADNSIEPNILSPESSIIHVILNSAKEKRQESCMGPQRECNDMAFPKVEMRHVAQYLSGRDS
mmetsp:Transcript_20063/g.61005  ORF Transcript_20063/g.61005 Transcript_20063/m.61005 type:complete len:95 (+) Transcript_20063:165-449(+)|eukprot:scaffold26460_cov27-Tisochrysis_lutea.AAC.1